MNQKFQKQLQRRGLFDFPLPFLITQVSFCQTILPFYRGEEPFSKNSFIRFFQRMRYNDVYAVKCKRWLWKLEINRYVNNALGRSFLWSTWLRNKTFTNPDFHVFRGWHKLSFLKNIYMLKKHYWYASIGIWFYYLLNS